MLVKADIHIHTCLSPCADLILSPKRVIEKAVESELNLIFITDHNTAENAESAMRASKVFKGIKVYPGIEISSREEVHTLALFEKVRDAYRTQEYIYRFLPDTNMNEEIENQIIVNEKDEVEGFLKKSLFSSVDLSIEKIIELIQSNNGLAVAAHVDKGSFSVISQLGFIPENLSFDALEVSSHMSLEKAIINYPENSEKFRFLTGSDAHSLNVIGSAFTSYEAEDNSFNNFIKFIHERPIITYS